MKRIAIAANRHLKPFDSAFSYKQDFVNEAYIELIRQSGATPYIIPYTKPIECEDILEGFDALLITGGSDIDPILYGEKDNGLSKNLDPELDRFQQTLISNAQKKGVPILGICRGFELINVIYGGTLYQDILSERPDAINHMRDDEPYSGVHKIKVVEGTFLDSVFTEPSIMVNSLHHQGVKTLGFGLKASAFAPDGIIEAFEGENVLAVQWHPESMADGMNDLFKAFIEEFIIE